MTVNRRWLHASNMIGLGALLASLCLACTPGKSSSGSGGMATDAGGTGGRASGSDASGNDSAASGGTTGSGGAFAGTGGVGTGGAGTGGAGTGGASTGGASGTGSGGQGSGGSGSGGSGTGGAGPATGGAAGAGTGGASGGAAGTAGSAGTPCAYKLCEGFESGTVGDPPTGWTILNGYGADAMKGVGLADDQFRSGHMALKSSSMTAGQGRVQKSLAALGATAAKHWGRIFYKVQSPAPKPASGAVIHLTLAALQGTTENRIVDTVEMSNGTHQWIFNVPDDSCCTGSSYDWSFDAAWHCAEWYVDVSAKSYRFFTDNTEVTTLAFTGNANAKMSSYTALALGGIFYQTPPTPFVIWFDDLAIDDAQIHCQ